MHSTSTCRRVPTYLHIAHVYTKAVSRRQLEQSVLARHCTQLRRAAGVALRRLVVAPSEDSTKPSADCLFQWLASASEGLFLHASPVHVDLHHLQQPCNRAAALASLLEIRILTSFNMSVLSRICGAGMVSSLVPRQHRHNDTADIYITAPPAYAHAAEYLAGRAQHAAGTAALAGRAKASGAALARELLCKQGSTPQLTPDAKDDLVRMRLPSGKVQAVSCASLSTVMQAYADFCPSEQPYTYCRAGKSATASAARPSQPLPPPAAELACDLQRPLSKAASRMHSGITPNQQDGLLPHAALEVVSRPGPHQDGAAHDVRARRVHESHDGSQSEADSCTALEEARISVVHIPLLQPHHRIFFSQLLPPPIASPPSSHTPSQDLNAQGSASMDTPTAARDACADMDLAGLVLPYVVQCAAGYAPHAAWDAC